MSALAPATLSTTPACNHCTAGPGQDCDPYCVALLGRDDTTDQETSVPTTNYGPIHPTGLEDYTATALQDFAGDYDLPQLVSALRDAVQLELDRTHPGVTLTGDELVGPHPRIEGFDPTAVLEAVDFWPLAARYDCAREAQVDAPATITAV